MARHVVARNGFNVNRAGVVYLRAVEGRDIALPAARLGTASSAVFAELLELAEEMRP